MFFRIGVVTKALAALSIIFLSTHHCIANPTDNKPVDADARADAHDQAFIRMNAPLATGEFSVTVEQLPERDATRLTLSGKMWEAGFKGEGVPDDAWDALISFVIPDQQADIRALGSLRTWKSGDVTELYSAEPIAPDAALWTKKTAPELGSFEVWNGDTRDHRLTDSAIVSLFHAMILPEQSDDQSPEGTTCDPTFEGCMGSANNSCKHGIASFEYHCEEGSVTCKFSCHGPDPKPGPE